jgi:hypothetical protein
MGLIFVLLCQLKDRWSYAAAVRYRERTQCHRHTNFEISFVNQQLHRWAAAGTYKLMFRRCNV